MNTFFEAIVILLLTTRLQYAAGCGTKNIICLNNTAYQFCFNVSNSIVTTGDVTICSSGTVCDANIGNYACITDTSPTSTESTTSTTQSVTLTSRAAVTPPSECHSPEKFPTENCTQYYECVPSFWWFNLETKSCASGEAFSSTELICVTNSSCDPETGIFVTNTTATEVTEPVLSMESASIDPSNTNPETESTTETISTNTIPISSTTQETSTTPVTITTEEATTLVTTTTESTTTTPVTTTTDSTTTTPVTTTTESTTPVTTTTESTTTTPVTTTTESTTTTPVTTSTTPVPITPPAECHSSVKYPAENCTQYYECVPSFWWFNLETKSCASGEAFSSTELICVTNSSCDPETGTFVTGTTLPNTIPISSTTEETITTPVTTTTDETTTTPVTTTTESTTTTPETTITESTTTTPVTTTTEQATTTTTTTTPGTTTEKSTTTPVPITPPASCTSSGKYPGTNCHEYYECVEVMYWYELVVQNCAAGQSFNNTQQACVTDPGCPA